ncbi:aryl-sulfate sulfotransferase [Shewanella sp. NIFS-20-20]|uniref:aryl-sulfate sulfotransferase n=1 Tax=Shewanella sp. NIFS-20-20 TaxID=2853806 RepID=UPI001C44732F|nr:aryl-sulfate sulfotransferase [Shewanella sp. NIFS-20-20]MBV7317455.1 aryl-sulfate sulfotransferase [Shewanella sp. NIFS-20-20]
MLKKTVLAVSLALGVVASVQAAGLTAVPQAPFGATIHVNPYENAPQTAIIGLNGHKVKHVSIKVHGKGKGGVDIEYPVSDKSVLTYGGVPVFGMYPAQANKVTMKWTDEQGKKKSHDFSIFAEAIKFESQGGLQTALAPEANVIKKPVKGFENRLYLVELNAAIPGSSPFKRNKLGIGAYDWDASPQIMIYDTNGDIRWTLDPNAAHDSNNPEKMGFLMDVNQLQDGTLIYGQGQAYHKMDLIGRPIYDRGIPEGYVDFSHEVVQLDNGHVMLRVGKKDYRNDVGDVVDTVRDTIIEVDENGAVVDEWILAEILDPYRDITILALDQGAVCLNVDANKSGETFSKEDLRKLPYGDVAGSAAGRNWAHVNSIGYNPGDDSIIISSRHQNAVIKIGRDKEVKWIIADPRGWNSKLANKVLTPVDSKGNKLNCAEGRCDGGFEWQATQHTAWAVPERGTVTVFDNGDARFNEQPALPTDKYSRAVEYKVDERNMTVQQVWQFGKERGYDWYGAITSEVHWQTDKDTMFIFNGSIGIMDKKQKSSVIEIDPETDKIKFEMEVKGNKAGAVGYRAEIIKPLF